MDKKVYQSMAGTMHTWGDFKEWAENHLARLRKARAGRASNFSTPLFRGQANSKWKLETTWERTGHRDLPTRDYYHWVTSVIKDMPRRVRDNWSTDEYDNFDYRSITRIEGMPNLNAIVYLRQYGFPSPLLDWTECPYIAAYFAFVDIPEGSREVAVYNYQEHKGTGKFTAENRARIVTQRPRSPISKRHARQKCEYTMCVKGWCPPIRNDVIFCRHGEVFEKNDALAFKGQDVREEFLLPVSEQKVALRDLFSMGITPYFLFQTKDALGKTAQLKCLFNLC